MYLTKTMKSILEILGIDMFNYTLTINSANDININIKDDTFGDMRTTQLISYTPVDNRVYFSPEEDLYIGKLAISNKFYMNGSLINIKPFLNMLLIIILEGNEEYISVIDGSLFTKTIFRFIGINDDELDNLIYDRISKYYDELKLTLI